MRVIDWVLMQQISKNKYPLSGISNLLDQLGGANIFLSVDLYSGFDQIKLQMEDTSILHLEQDNIITKYLVMLFGVTNATTVFTKFLLSI